MDQKDVIITSEINEEQKETVAKLYFQTFQLKFHYLWLFTKKEDKAVIVLKRSIPYQEGLYAVQDDEVIGFVGLEKGNGYYAPLSFIGFWEAFGIWGASWRYVAYTIYRLFHGKNKQDEVHIDPIVVSGKARGMGIGTRLLEAVFELAKKKKKRKVILEVVDTNPKAKRLYERVGFRVAKTDNLALLTKEAGFAQVIHMEKVLAYTAEA